MAKLPTYDAPMIAPQAGPNGALNIQAPNLLAPVAQGGMNLVSDYNKVVQQAEVMKAEDALNKVRAAQTEYTGWVRGLKGKDAFDPKVYGGEGNASLSATAATWMDGAIQDAGKGLSGHAAHVFKQGADRFKVELDGHVQHQEMLESSVVAKDTYNGVLAVEDQNVAQNGVSPDGRIQGDSISQSIQRKVFAAGQLSDHLGEGPEMRKARELEARSSAHAIVLDALLKRNNAQGAQAYFDTNRSQLDKGVISTMEGKIHQSALANDVQTMAQEADASGKPLDEQLAWVDQKTKGNADLQKALSSEVEHRYTVKQHVKAVATQESTGKLWDMRFPTKPGQVAVSMPDIMRTPEWAALDGEKGNQLRAQWESYTKRNENDPATAVAKYATYQRFLDDPKALMGLSDPQIASFTGALGPELAMRLMDAKRKAAGNLDAMKANTLNDIPFKDIAAEYGIKVKGNLSQDESARMGLLRDKVLESVRAEQDATGKILGPERKEEILRRLLVDVSSKKKGDFFNWDHPLFEVKDFTELNATDEEKTLAVKYLVQADSPVNPSNVQTMVEAIRARKAK